MEVLLVVYSLFAIKTTLGLTALYTRASSPCTNFLDDCFSYGFLVCYDSRYRQWAEDNCRLYCGYCGDAGLYGKCHYKGVTYQQGETWTDGCAYDCECVDEHSGRYSCTNRCRIYFGLPDHCSLIQKSNECCKQPQCSINQHTQTIASSYVGSGSISGNGIEKSREATLPPCVDKIRNCQRYGLEVCTDFIQWSEENCRQNCNFCNLKPTPGELDKCMFNGKTLSQGDRWLVGCDTECVCEDARYGYYRCITICPTYTNLPPGCRLMKNTGDCCQSITCKTGYLHDSSINTISGNITSVQNVTQLYITLTTPTAETSTEPIPLTQCIDSTFIKCSDSHVCIDTYLRRLCPDTCKLCAQTSTEPIPLTRCIDSTFIKCSDSHVCKDTYLRRLCPVTCKLCAQTTTQPNPLTQCIDSTFIKCSDSHVCMDTYLRRLCPVTCKLCAQTTTQPNPLTQCIDSTFIKCSDSHVCIDTYLRRLCPVTCKLCVQTTTPPCVDATYIVCADGHVCGDAYLRQKCPVSCGICAGSVKITTPRWIHIIGK